MLVLTLCLSLVLVNASAAETDNISGAGRVTTSSGSLNVRSGPSSSSTIKTSIPRNSYVTLLYKTNNFWYVRYSLNGYGYCHGDYITLASSDTQYVKTTSGNLRVRSSASQSATVKTTLPTGTPLTVLSKSGNFSQVVYNGNQVGYVHSDYIVKYKKISLSVHDFKQTDSRWANVTLGTSGQTIAKIGCATTALAMTESYRTGTTIYPHQMAKKLSYTSGGAVYWPTNYNIVTSQTGYLKVIYDTLMQGKPVIVGAKNSYGGQHYVVVTGITSTNTLSASSFYINDPGSKTRKNLSQFFNEYPNFYKMLYAK